MSSDTGTDTSQKSNFIREIIDTDLRDGNIQGEVVTRFPPEPNGYLHIGHAKSICLNFGLAQDYEGRCHLRFDDTNPTTEEVEFVENIQNDVRWLGFDWGRHLYYASDYFGQLYKWAVQLIKAGKAYVDDLSEEEIRSYRGTVTEPGTESPYRNRSVKENLDLFERMKKGEFEDGSKVLRAKIDMASPNMKMRDPLMYRIRHEHHYRTGDDWCIYPMYDWAHGQSDAIEGITHSICTLEFENNRELYDWFLDNLGIEPRPHQYEFARLNLDYTLMSKRKLLQLVEEGHVSGWDDPRMPTIAGMRRRGVTPAAIRAFCDRIGVAKADNRIDMGLLEYFIRDDLNQTAPRIMAVLRPLKVILTNYPDNQTEWLNADYYPRDIPKEGSRLIPFSREIYIERTDFHENPPKSYYRLAPGREVRLRDAYIIRCNEIERDPVTGEVTALYCTYDPDTKSGTEGSKRKVKGTLHWVSVEHAQEAEVRLYDRLFIDPEPDGGEEDFRTYLNPDSVEILTGCKIEPGITDEPADIRYQFLRQGFFFRDDRDSGETGPVFNRIVQLRDSWAKRTKAVKKAESKETKSPTKQRTQPAEKNESASRTALSLDDPEVKTRLERFMMELGLAEDQAERIAVDAGLSTFFEKALTEHNSPASVANWVVNDVLGALKGHEVGRLPFEGVAIGKLTRLVEDGTISNRQAKDVFEAMLESGRDPEEIVEAQGLKQVSDLSTLNPIIESLVESNPDKVEAYRSGKRGLIGFFIGQVMRKTGGRANPQLVKDLVQSRLES